MNESTSHRNEKHVFINKYFNMNERLKPLLDDVGGPLAALARKAAAASELTLVVRQELPEPLRCHVLSAVQRGEDLVVIVDSAAWSARVRYAGRRLRERLQVLGRPVPGRLRVKVGAAPAPAVRP